jgi:hypothetical protein
MTQHFIPTHGGFEKLFSYKKAEIIYDATVYFTNRFFRKGHIRPRLERTCFAIKDPTTGYNNYFFLSLLLKPG